MQALCRNERNQNPSIGVCRCSRSTYSNSTFVTKLQNTFFKIKPDALKQRMIRVNLIHLTYAQKCRCRIQQLRMNSQIRQLATYFDFPFFSYLSWRSASWDLLHWYLLQCIIELTLHQFLECRHQSACVSLSCHFTWIHLLWMLPFCRRARAYHVSFIGGHCPAKVLVFVWPKNSDPLAH